MITIPAPTGGWNAVSALTDMPPTDAIVMENLIPQATDVRSRDGYAAHTTVARADAYTLVSYNAGTPKLLMGGGGNIYDVTTSGAGTDLTASLPAFTNNYWHDNGYKDKIILCNGADTPLVYDGSSISQLSLTIGSSSATDEITNGDFATDSDWVKGTGWTISAGNASSDGTQSADSDLSQTVTPDEGRIYKVEFTVSGYSAGNVTAFLGGTEGTARAADGTFTEYIVAGAGTDIDIRADSDFVGDVDDVKVYGTALAPSKLIGSVTFKGRVIYWEAPTGDNAQSFWYASAGAYTGDLTKFDLSEFTKGGYIVSCFNWNHDGGDGLDDYLAVIMSTGQVAIYQGSDPGSATDWAMVGVYSIGEPVSGRHPVTAIGGDGIILTKDGYVVLSAAIQDGRYSENSHYSFKISAAAAAAAQDYGSKDGWSATLHTGGSLFVVNVPISDTESVQHVRNTTTGAWTKFTGLNAAAFCAHDGGLYFVGTDGKVYRYSGGSDKGEFIPMRCTQAYSYFGDPKKKLVTSVRVMSNYRFPKYLHSSFWADFNEKTLPAITDPPEGSPPDWDVAQWDVAEWGAATLGTITERRNASGYGFALAHTLRLRSRAQRFIWYASHIYLRASGVV